MTRSRLAAIFAALLFAVTTAYAEEKPIKIGFLVDLSGVAAPGGKVMLNGMQMYLDEIGNKMAGRPVELVTANIESSPASAAAALTKMVKEEHVDIVGGVLLANVGYALQPFVEKLQVPMVYSVTGGDNVTQRNHGDWIVRASFSASQPNLPFGEWVYKNLHYKRVVTFGMDYAFGYEVVGGFQKSFEEAGGKVIQKIWAPLGGTDYSPFVHDIRKDADAVFVATAVGAALQFPKAYKASGLTMPVIAGGTSYDESILAAQGDDALGAVSAFPYSAALDNPANKRFVKAYHERFGIDPSFYALCSYTTGRMIDRAIESLHGKTDDKAAIVAALKKVEFKDDPRGPFKIDAYGNPIENVYLRRVEKKNGKLQNTVFGTIPNVSQFWKYDPSKYMAEPAFTRDYPPCKYCEQK